jgi:hypothetical protein
MKVTKYPSCGEVIRLLEEILEWDEDRFREHHHRHRHRAKQMAFTIAFKSITVQGVRMTFTMLPGQSVTAVVSPVLADGTTASRATLSNVTYTSSDPTVLTAVQDPTNPSAVIITGLGVAGSAIVTASATATEADGVTTEVITGAVTVVLAVPPPAPAAALVFTFGTPTP